VDLLVSVENKELTEKLSSLESTLTKNIGGRGCYGQESDQDSCPEEHRDEGSLFMYQGGFPS
jgi:hypothetical protein